MGANQSTRSAPTPGEEGNTRFQLREGGEGRAHKSYMSASGTLRGNAEDWLSVTRTHAYMFNVCSANLIFYEVNGKNGRSLRARSKRSDFSVVSSLEERVFFYLLRGRVYKVTLTSNSTNKMKTVLPLRSN